MAVCYVIALQRCARKLWRGESHELCRCEHQLARIAQEERGTAD